jgi:hypothetical protein
VIATAILSIFSFISGLIVFAITSLIHNNSLVNGWQLFIHYLNTNIDISLKRYLFVVIVIFFIITIVNPLYKKIKFRRINLNVDEETQNTSAFDERLPQIYERSTTFFDSRIGDAFPGQRGLKWYKDRKTAAARLQILLRSPLIFAAGELINEPVCWFRGGRNASVKSCEALTKTKVLMDHHEYEIEEVAVYRDDSPEKNFVYVKVKAESPIGVYNWTKDDIFRNVDFYGFHKEEYALFNNKYPVTREEYDDGSAEINGKVIESKDSKLRIRYLTSYNFIIAAKQSPINSREFDKGSQAILDGLLRGSHTFEQLVDFLIALDNPICL